MSLYDDLEWRGLVKQVTDPALRNALMQDRMTLYCGFDPTSDSLHVGSLLPLLCLRRFQNSGHKVIALVGGATGMIGDPSGKAGERSLLTTDQIRHNQEGISRVIAKFLDLQGPNPAQIVNNADWAGRYTFIDFLRDVGKHFTINYMVAKESVRSRLEDREHGISYTEFSYMILQAYDFCHLHNQHGCRLQIGGSDQWGNITAGTDLIRKMRAVHGTSTPDLGEVFGLTFPLVTKADGTKFGKSEKGNLWLDARKTSPYRFYQFFLQTTDSDAAVYLKYFSFLPQERIQQLEQSLSREPEKRECQKALARELTALVHGEAELQKAEKASQALFGTEIRELDASTLRDLLADAPTQNKPRSALLNGIPVIDLLVESLLCASKGAARKDITGGGIYLNNIRVTDPAAMIRDTDLIAGESAQGCLILRKGKKNYFVWHFSS